ncbi:MAG: PD40 domain-containing protein [Acidobacteria bacterium]|nr:PD40 domain-containing protein [Acidobacteriota bacterium]
MMVAFMIGRTVAHYQILDKLGEGGMGVVYRALDTHLDRTVAIKVLPAEAVANPERKKRFVQEAKAASALNHPNIVTIYDIDTADGVDYIAMEYVAGKTLDHLIGRGGLRLGETLKYAIEIAGALAAAHGAGIVHRDLKPANIMVAEKGSVKVLDFGLAKLTETASSDNGLTATLRDAPRTEEGTIVGTVAYMSPEQAEGKKVNARSDIFSFGSVLYEMLTGRRAFHGETKISTLSAILHQEPKPVEDLPRELATVLARCLRKDSDRRFQHMDDVKIALEEAKEQADSGTVEAREEAKRGRGQRVLLATAAALALIGASAGVAWWLARSGGPKTGQGPVLTRLTSDPGLTTEPTYWAAGNLVAYASDRSGEGNLDIWVQQLGSGEPNRLTRNPSDDHEPSFSPDGSKIAFRSEREGGGIYVISTLGGTERKIAERGRRPRFSPDGNWVAYWLGEPASQRGAPGQIFVVAATGGTPRLVQPDFRGVRNPVWLPDGKHLLFEGVTGRQGVYDWWVTPVDSGKAIPTGAYALFERHKLAPEDPGVWTGDQIVFPARLGDSTNLWQLSISPRTFQVSGAPQRLTSGTGVEGDPSLVAGRLVFSSVNENVDLWSLPLNPNQAKVTGELQRLTQDIAPDIQPSITPDGKKVVFSSRRSGNWDVWMKDLGTGGETALTATPLDEFNPRITFDGATVAYRVQEGPKASVFVMPLGGVARKVCDACGAFPWSPDGKNILLSGGPGLGLIDAATGERTPILRHPEHGLAAPSFSWDGRWVAFYGQIAPGRTRVYVASFRGHQPVPHTEWIQITDGSAWDVVPRFSPDGNLLYVLSQRDGARCLWAVRLDPATKKPLAAPFPVYHFHSARRSPIYVRSGQVATDIARDKMVITIDERAGNVWMAQL